MHIRTSMGTKKWACLKRVVFVWKAVFFSFLLLILLQIIPIVTTHVLIVTLLTYQS